MRPAEPPSPLLARFPTATDGKSSANGGGLSAFGFTGSSVLPIIDPVRGVAWKRSARPDPAGNVAVARASSGNIFFREYDFESRVSSRKFAESPFTHSME